MAEADDIVMSSCSESMIFVKRDNARDSDESDEGDEFHDADEDVTAIDFGESRPVGSPSCSAETCFSSEEDCQSRFNIQVTGRFHRADSCIDECKSHDGRLKYFCKNCDKVACSVCNNLDHRDCKGVEYIPTFVINSEDEFDKKCRQFEQELGSVEKKLRINKNKLAINRGTAEHLKKTALCKVQTTRREIGEFLGRLEEDLQHKIDEIESEEMKNLDQVEKCDRKINLEFQEIKDTYQDRQKRGHRSSVFTHVTLNAPYLDKMNTELKKLDAENRISKYTFETSEAVKQILSIKELGLLTNLAVSSTPTTLEKTRSIYIREQADENPCKITGLAVLNSGRLVAVDCGNKSVKLIDTETGEIMYVERLPEEPLDVTVIDDVVLQSEAKNAFVETIAVTLPGENKILTLSVQVNAGAWALVTKSEIKVNGSCRGIAYDKRQLYVTFPKQAKIEVIDLEGNLLKRITNESINRQLFEPQFITLGAMKGMLYVTDKEDHCVLSLSSNGDILKSFQDYDMMQPRGICSSREGAVFVCSFSVGKVFQLAEELECLTAIDVEKENTNRTYPYSVAFCDSTKVLYSGRFLHDYITSYACKDQTPVL